MRIFGSRYGYTVVPEETRSKLRIVDGTVTNLSVTEGTTLVEMLLANKYWARDKNVDRLQRDLNALLNSRDQLLQELSAAGWDPTQPSSEALSGELGEPEDEEKPPGNKLRPI
jgi:hypothetical protein